MIMSDGLIWALGMAFAVCAYFAGKVTGRLSCREDMERADAEHLRCRIAVAEALPVLESVRNFLAGMARLVSITRLAQYEEAYNKLEQMAWREGPKYRHLRRGSTYEILTEQVHLNASDPRLLADGELMTLYVDTNIGRICIRHPDEFHDGRFEKVEGGALPWNLPPGLREGGA